MDFLVKTLGKNDWLLWEVGVTRIVIHPGYSKSGSLPLRCYVMSIKIYMYELNLNKMRIKYTLSLTLTPKQASERASEQGSKQANKQKHIENDTTNNKQAY